MLTTINTNMLNFIQLNIVYGFLDSREYQPDIEAGKLKMAGNNDNKSTVPHLSSCENN